MGTLDSLKILWNSVHESQKQGEQSRPIPACPWTPDESDIRRVSGAVRDRLSNARQQFLHAAKSVLYAAFPSLPSNLATTRRSLDAEQQFVQARDANLPPNSHAGLKLVLVALRRVRAGWNRYSTNSLTLCTFTAAALRVTECGRPRIRRTSLLRETPCAPS